MTFDLLPYEIFQLVALSLGQKKQELAECCLVCTDWLPLFMEQLYLNITICGPPSFQHFYTCLSTPTSTRYTRHRQLLIRTLSIQDGNISQDEMNHLPRLCPRLEQLTIDGRAHWDHAMPSLFNKTSGQQQNNGTEASKAIDNTTKTNATWWPYLKSACILATSITPTVMQNAPQLTRLALRCMFDGRLSQHLVSALKQTPLLNYLSIDECESSLQQLEAIHDACPSLIQLRLVHTIIDNTDYNPSITLPPTSASSSHQRVSRGNIIAPSSTLRQLILQEVTILDDDYNQLSDWFMYIAMKYPRLESLEWWQKSPLGLTDTPHIDTSVALYLTSQCPLLRSARLFNINVDSIFYHSLLERTQQLHHPLSLSNSQVKELGMNYSLDLGHCAQQLQSYLLWWNEKESPLDYIPRLPSSLVSLHLSGRMCYSSFDMNLIFDQCPHLEFLQLDFGTLDQVAPEHAYQWKKQHPLKRLIMEEVKFSALAFKSVAFRCRDLIELDLLDCILTDGEGNVNIYQGEGNTGSNSNGSTLDNDDDDDSDGRNHGRLVFPYQHFEKVKLCGFRFALNPSLRAKTVGIYEMDKILQQERWYYLSHHATFLSYVPVHSCRYKLPVHAIKQHCIVKSLPTPSPSSTSAPSNHDDINYSSSPLPPQQQQQQRLLVPPTELNALREMQRQYGKFGRDAPCAGYLTLVCQSINSLYLENRRI
ncbi:hypothetical protein BCR42DRAFT_425148 [Absidia repens]|uniref:F-box domain-containing protein n=1 Tax=Absidia repens TaxID=90262 RepID=A0A1X2I3L8_9FUNG|nr:hypothetical protein BCR42DRAFT_425148 [Absidia repens]